MPIRRNGHDACKTFGVGARQAGARLGAPILRQLFAAGALAQRATEHGGFRLTEKGDAILFGRETIVLRAETRAARAASRGSAVARPSDDAALAPRARPTRPCSSTCAACAPTIARAEGIAAFMVFPDRTLIEMAQLQARRPPGAAPRPRRRRAQAQAYGDAFVAAIADFLFSPRRRRPPAERFSLVRAGRGRVGTLPRSE